MAIQFNIIASPSLVLSISSILGCVTGTLHKMQAPAGQVTLKRRSLEVDTLKPVGGELEME